MSSFDRLAKVKGHAPLEVCRRLAELAGRVDGDHAIVEIGVFKGRTLLHMAHGARRGGGARVFGVDPWNLPGDRAPFGGKKKGQANHEYTDAKTYSTVRDNVRRQGMSRYVTLVRGFSVDVAQQWDGPPVGLLFVDGDHRYDAVLADLWSWTPHLAPGAIVVFDDYKPSHPEVIDAVDHLEGVGEIVVLSREFDSIVVAQLGTGEVEPVIEVPTVEVTPDDVETGPETDPEAAGEPVDDPEASPLVSASPEVPEVPRETQESATLEVASPDPDVVEPVDPSQEAQGSTGASAPETASGELDGLSVRQLRGVAKQRGVVLGTLTRRQDIVAKILAG